MLKHSAEHTRVHPVGGAATIEVDLIVTPIVCPFRAASKVCQITAPQLQGNRVFLRVEVQEALAVTVYECTGSDHFPL